MKIKTGKIIDFRGSWNSGLGYLIIENKTGKIISIPCDNAPTIRALEACFGNVITEDHTANGKGYKNKWIKYSLTPWETLAGFTPIDLE